MEGVGDHHPWRVRIRENLTILQRHSTSASVWIRWLGCGRLLFSLPWSLVKRLTLSFRRLG